MEEPSSSESSSSELPIVNEVTEKKKVTVGSIQLDKGRVLGKGAFGAVYWGKCRYREVAVKRIQYRDVDEEKLIQKEVTNMTAVEEDAKNVIRYYHLEKSPDFYYIAMELAAGTVNDFIKGRQDNFGNPFPKTDGITIIRDASTGLAWLHSKNIVHRDIKPGNLLLVYNKSGQVITKLADFGLSRELTVSHATMSTGVGTKAWMAPEVSISGGQKDTEGASDVFSMGLVFYFVLSKGKHPDEDKDTRKASIKIWISSVEANQVDQTAKNLIEVMTREDPTERPSSYRVTFHPAMWETETKKGFFQAVSDLIKDGKDTDLKEEVNKHHEQVFGGDQDKPGDWRKMLDSHSLDKGDFKSYKDPSVSELLRMVRNKVHHFADIPEEGQAAVDKTSNGLIEYVTKEFPYLLLYVWLGAQLRRTTSTLLQFYRSVHLSLQTLQDIGVKITEDRTVLKATRSGIPLIAVFETGICKHLRQLDIRGFTLDEWSLRGLLRNNGASLKTLLLPDGVSKDLMELLSRGLKSLRSLEKLSVTAADFPGLIKSLPMSLAINIRGPEVAEPIWPGRSSRLCVSLQGLDGRATDICLSSLSSLGDRLKELSIYDCAPPQTGPGRLPGLKVLCLSGGDTVDAWLDRAGERCPGLVWLWLGSWDMPPQHLTDAGAVSRLFRSCPWLVELYLYSTADACRAVITALQQTDLGWDSGRPRTIQLWVPEEYRDLGRLGNDRVIVEPWLRYRDQPC